MTEKEKEKKSCCFFFSLKPLERQRGVKVNLKRTATAKVYLRGSCSMHFLNMGLPLCYKDNKTQVLESSIQKKFWVIST